MLKIGSPICFSNFQLVCFNVFFFHYWKKWWFFHFLTFLPCLFQLWGPWHRQVWIGVFVAIPRTTTWPWWRWAPRWPASAKLAPSGMPCICGAWFRTVPTVWVVITKAKSSNKNQVFFRGVDKKHTVLELFCLGLEILGRIAFIQCTQWSSSFSRILFDSHPTSWKRTLSNIPSTTIFWVVWARHDTGTVISTFPGNTSRTWALCPRKPMAWNRIAVASRPISWRPRSTRPWVSWRTRARSSSHPFAAPKSFSKSWGETESAGWSCRKTPKKEWTKRPGVDFFLVLWKHFVHFCQVVSQPPGRPWWNWMPTWQRWTTGAMQIRITSSSPTTTWMLPDRSMKFDLRSCVVTELSFSKTCPTKWTLANVTMFSTLGSAFKPWQVDNGYFWRNATGELELGVFDWGSMGSKSLGFKMWWWMYCQDFEAEKNITFSMIAAESMNILIF